MRVDKVIQITRLFFGWESRASPRREAGQWCAAGSTPPRVGAALRLGAHGGPQPTCAGRRRADAHSLLVAPNTHQASVGSSEGDACWICLDDSAPDGDTLLISPCRCPRKVHPKCLARWQLQQAGKHEEKFCRCVRGPWPRAHCP
jgi:hypothetical protein